MKQPNPLYTIVPDTRRALSDGAYPLKLRITYRGERKYYATGHHAKLTDWEKMQTGPVRGRLLETRHATEEILVQARKCGGQLPVFSFRQFEKVFFPKRTKNDLVADIFNVYVKNLRENGQVGSAIAYKNACISLLKFRPNLRLDQVTVDFLRQYEKWYTASGKSITSVGIRMRHLRAIIRVAINEGNLPAESYPFGRGKYVIPEGRNIKKALFPQEIASIYSYKAEAGSDEEMARDCWLFIYLCNGLNVKDMCLLKYRNLDGDFLTFRRAKTKNTRRSAEPIRVALKEDTQRVIARWGQKTISADSYIFPFLTTGIPDPEVQHLQIRKAVLFINRYMKRIAAALGITKPVTTYCARHSFATVLKNSGVSTEFISEALGHSSLSTTRHYLDGFESNSIRKTTDLLLVFHQKEDQEKN